MVQLSAEIRIGLRLEFGHSDYGYLLNKFVVQSTSEIQASSDFGALKYVPLLNRLVIG